MCYNDAVRGGPPTLEDDMAGSLERGTVRVLGLVGGPEHDLFGERLLRAAIEVAPPGVEVELFDLGGFPLHSSDAGRAGEPRAVVELKEAIRRCDAVLIAARECHRGLSGALENALDWASRPRGASVLEGRPVAVLDAAAGATGKVGTRIRLRQTIAFSEAWDVFAKTSNLGASASDEA
jgi:chromate reductase, NAD(P)H dehydrogenase (quinone)